MLHLSLRISATAVLVALFAGCSCNDDPKTAPLAYCANDNQCTDGKVCIDHKCRTIMTEDDGGPGDNDAETGLSLESLRVDPEEATLSCDYAAADNAKPKQKFTVYAKYSDGNEYEIPGVNFEIAPLALGDIDPAGGEFKANCLIAGAAKVTASVSAGGQTFAAEADLTVNISRTVKGDGVPSDVADKFTNTTTDSGLSANVVYPLNGAVMPQNVYPVDLQWERGDADDLFRITMAKEHVSVVTYVLHSGDGFDNHWVFDDASWRLIAQSDPDEDATILVDRYVNAQSLAVTTEAVSVRFARAAITGTVYYWDIEAGRSIRINDGTAEAESYMPSPPKAYAAQPEKYRCIGCHSVSPSGRYIAGQLGVMTGDFAEGVDLINAYNSGNLKGGVIYDLTSDLTGNPPPVAYSSGMIKAYNWFFSTWSPDETRLLVSEDRFFGSGNGGVGSFRLFDPIDGTPVDKNPSNMATGLSATYNGTHPAWSPDGTQVAYVSGKGTGTLPFYLDAQWGGDNTAGSISMIDVTGPDTFGNNRVILAGNSPLIQNGVGGSAASYPTWSKDSKKIAFAHGNSSRSENGTSTLYIMNRDGSDVVRLLKAAPGTDNFQPRFSPFQQGGYYWMSFLSRRQYGNAAIGTGNTTYQQIWVSAISDHAAAGEDPSSVPYWVPGQNVKSRNISAFWAPRPCRVNGESCAVGSECCGGDCRPNMDNVLVCSPPPPERCREYNETCSTSADCCSGYTCSSNVCIIPVN